MILCHLHRSENELLEDINLYCSFVARAPTFAISGFYSSKARRAAGNSNQKVLFLSSSDKTIRD
jgi:hypothetical protein